MKVEKEGDIFEAITFPDDVRTDKREVCLFKALKKVGFYRNGEGPSFTPEELRELLPCLQRAVEHKIFEPTPKYELVELCKDTFAIRKIGTELFYDRPNNWLFSTAALFTGVEAKVMLAKLENEE